MVNLMISAYYGFLKMDCKKVRLMQIGGFILVGTC